MKRTQRNMTAARRALKRAGTAVRDVAYRALMAVLICATCLSSFPAEAVAEEVDLPAITVSANALDKLAAFFGIGDGSDDEDAETDASDDADDADVDAQTAEEYAETGVVDASNLDDPDEVTLVDAPELDLAEFEELTDDEPAASVEEAAEGAEVCDDADEGGLLSSILSSISSFFGAGTAWAEDDDDDDEVLSSYGGTTIESVEVSWETEDDEDDGDDSRLTLVKSDDDEFSVTVRLTFELSGSHDYEEGEIQITIPKTIFEDRWGDETGTMELSVPEAPDSNATFAYTETEDAYVITNAKTLSAASSIMMEFAISGLTASTLVGNGELDDGETSGTGVEKYVSDAFYAVVEVATEDGTVIAMTSNSIDASIDTGSSVTRATNTVSGGVSLSYPSSWPDALEPDGSDGYIYVCFYSYIYVKGSQYYSLDFTTDVSGTGIEGAYVLGVKYSGTVYANEDADADMTVTLETSDYDTGTGYYVYTYVAIPASAITAGTTYTFEDTVTYTLTDADDGEATTKSATASKSYSPVAYTATEGYVGLSKTGGNTYKNGLDELEQGEDVDASYTVKTSAFVESKEAVTVETYDGTLWLDTSDHVLTGDDYEISSVTISSATPYVYQQYEESGSGYYWSGSTLISGTVDGGNWGYASSSDKTLVPDLYLYGSEDEGETWTLYATISWSTGSMSITGENGASASSSTVTFPGDADITDIKTVFTIDQTDEDCADGVIYTIKPTVTLKASSGTVAAIVDGLFEESDLPETKLRDTAWVYAYDTGETDPWGYASAGAYDYLYGSGMAATMEKTLSYENDTSNGQVLLTYTATVYETSNQTSRSAYNSSLSAGVWDKETSGTFYDLLPEGVVVDEESIEMSSSGDYVTSVETVEDYQGSGRTLLIVTVSLTPTVSYKSTSVTGAPYAGYGDSFTLTFDATYSWESMSDHGEELTNVIAFESGNDSLGTIEGYTGEPDDPTVGNSDASASATEGVETLMTDLDADRDDPVFLYAKATANLSSVLTTTVTGVSKTVSTDKGTWETGLDEDDAVNVYENQYYYYRLQVANDYQTEAKGIVLYDALDAYEPADTEDDNGDTQWKGTLVSVDTSVLEGLGIAPVVYYSTSEDLTLDDTDDTSDNDLTDTSIWSTTAPDDLSTVTAVAIDCSTASDGSDFVLGEEETLSAIIQMQAPSDVDESWYDTELADGETEAGTTGGAHAYNSVTMVSSAREEGSEGWTEDQMAVYSATKVGLSPYEVTVEKAWDDEDDQDGKRPESVTVALLADGEAVTDDDGNALTVTLSDENGWQASFDYVEPYGEDGERITYSFSETSDTGDIGAYTMAVARSELSTGGYAYTLTNTHEPETIDVSGAKTWDDDDDLNGARPESITVTLLADGEAVASQVVTEDDGWAYEFTDLDRYRDHGTEVVYTVEEAYEDGYVASYSDDGLSITNTYDPYGDLVIEKSVKDTTSAEDGAVFTFEVTFTDEDGEPVASSYSYEVYDAETDEVVSSGTIETGGEVQIKAEQYVIIHDVDSETVYAVEETELPDGFEQTDSTGSEGTILAGQTSTASFENTYSATGKAYVTAIKTLSGLALEARQFKFTLCDSDGNVVKTATNDAAGSVNLGSISYTIGDLGDDGTATFTYYLYEVDEGDAGYTYDASVYAVVVTVADDGDGTLSCKLAWYEASVTTDDEGSVTYSYDESKPLGVDEDGNAVAPTFENAYEAEGTLELTAWKTLDGRDLTEGEFTFEIEGVSGTDADGNAISSDDVPLPSETATAEDGTETETTVTTATNDADGTVSFSIDYDETDIGNTYTYTISEVVPEEGSEDDDETVVYSTEKLTYTVTVYDGGDSTLYFDAECADEDGAVIENELEDGTLTIQKTVETDEDYEGNESQEFTFYVQLTGVDIEDGTFEYTLNQLESAYEKESDGGDEEGDEESASAKAGTAIDVDGADDGADDDGADDGADDEGADDGADDEGTDGLQLAEGAVADASSSDDDIASGTSGTCSWLINDDYVLYIYPTDGDEGYLESTDYATSSDSVPWYSYRYQITGVVVEDGAHAGKTASALFSESYSLISFTDNNENESGGFVTEETTSLSYMFYDCTSLKNVDALSGWDTSSVTDLSYMFCNDASLENVDALSGWDTSSVTDLSYMFYYCTSLENVDALSDWDTSEVTTLKYTFYTCKNLVDIGGLSNWDTSSVTSMACTFCYCPLANVDALSDWDTSEVTTLASLFFNCTSLANVDGVSSWDTSKVTSFDCTFYGCTSLTSLNLSSWDTSSVTTFSSAFNACTSLTSLDLSGWDTSSVTNMSYMFYKCTSLTSLDLSGWDTSSVTNMSYMFYNCTSLASLDLSGWDTSKVTTRSYCFAGCSSLSSIKLGDKWDWTYGSSKTSYCSDEETGALPTPPTSRTSGKWVRDDSYYDAMDPATLATSWTTAYAGTWVWDYLPSTYEVEFNANTGGDSYSGSMANQTWSIYAVTDNYGTVFPACNYYRFGYEFAGWALSNSATTAAYQAGDTVPDNLADVGSTLVLYAVWTKIDTSYTVTGGGFTVNLKAGEAATVDVPAGTGYVVWEETPSGWVLVSSSGTSGTISANADSTVSFVNAVAEEKTTTATIVATKTLDGEAADADAFSFTLEDSSGETLQTVSNTSGGAVLFNAITYTEAGTYTYTISEVEGSDSTITYDTAVYTATVTVTADDDGYLSASVAYTDADGSAVTTPSFENETKPGSLTITKAFESTGSGYDDLTFTALVTFSDGTTQTVGLTSSNDWTATIEGIEAGTTYTVTETDIPDGYTIVGYTVDNVDAGTEAATGTVSADAESKVTITNGYSASGSFNAEAVKVLSGRDLESGEFTFNLTDSDGNVVATAQNAADGSVTFDAVTVTAAGTYTYYISEVVPDTDDDAYDADIVYDDHTATVTVAATDDGDGTLTCTVSYGTTDDDGSDVSNTFTNSLKTGSLAITKAFESTGSGYEDKTFTALLTLSDGTSQTVELTSGNDWTATIGGIYTGTTYTVTETDIPDGYTLVGYSVDDVDAGTEEASGTIAADTTSKVTITNSYNTGTATWTPTAEMTLTGGTDLTADEFTFYVADGEGTIVATGTNGAATSEGLVSSTVTSSITFTEVDGGLTYTLDDVGEYVYTVYEVVPTDADEDITYDESVYTVTVTVADAGDGTLSVSQTITDADGNVVDAVTFTNKYNHTSVLPITGGTGIFLGLTVAFLLLVASFVALQRRRRGAAATAGGGPAGSGGARSTGGGRYSATGNGSRSGFGSGTDGDSRGMHRASASDDADAPCGRHSAGGSGTGGSEGSSSSGGRHFK